jgi:cytochrome c
MKPARLALALGAIIATSVALSSIHPWGNPHEQSQSQILLQGSSAPEAVRQVLTSKCADCHSDSTHYPAYSRFAPVSWLLERDIQQGRQHLDLSQWQHYSIESQIDLLARIGSEVRNGQMPVRQYLLLHPQARLTPGEQQRIYDWTKVERKQLRKQSAEKAGGQTNPAQQGTSNVD